MKSDQDIFPYQETEDVEGRAVSAAGNAKVLAVIPARGGSKGVPRKNAKMLGGKPLVAYSIEVALKSRLIDKVVVSTEDEEIAEVARRYGSDIPLMRPAVLASDSARLSDTMAHAVSSVENCGYHPDFIVELLPTHPFRTPALVDFLVSKGLEGFSPVTTVREVDCGRSTHFVTSGDSLVPMQVKGSSGSPKAPYFRRYGLFNGYGYKVLRSSYMHVVNDPVSLIDIDYPDDFELAEYVLEEGHFIFE